MPPAKYSFSSWCQLACLVDQCSVGHLLSHRSQLCSQSFSTCQAKGRNRLAVVDVLEFCPCRASSSAEEELEMAWGKLDCSSHLAAQIPEGVVAVNLDYHFASSWSSSVSDPERVESLTTEQGTVR